MNGDAAYSGSALRWAARGAWLTLFGTVLSGPLSLVLVNATHPQPAWQDAATFVAHFHPVQTLPFFLGFALVGGLLTLVVSLSILAPSDLRPRTSLGAALACAFAALVLLNYAVQTTFVPQLVRRYGEADSAVLSAFTMSNPHSLGWSLEMWAYGVIGAATWLVAPVFAGDGVARATRVTFIANGVVSIASAVATALIPGWVLTVPGLVAFVLWNLLVVALSILTLRWLGRRRASTSTPPPAFAAPGRA